MWYWLVQQTLYYSRPEVYFLVYFDKLQRCEDTFWANLLKVKSMESILLLSPREDALVTQNIFVPNTVWHVQILLALLCRDYFAPKWLQFCTIVRSVLVANLVRCVPHEKRTNCNYSILFPSVSINKVIKCTILLFYYWEIK